MCIAIVLTFASYHAAPLASAFPLQSSLVELQRAIDTIVSSRELERTYWGILIESAKSGETIYALNADKLMMPASTLKVVTLAATAERLGWDYSYETLVVADGPVTGGTLHGNLVIVASGDPSLTRRAP